MKRLGKYCEEVTEIERDQTKRIAYSVMYGVGKFNFNCRLFRTNGNSPDLRPIDALMLLLT